MSSTAMHPHWQDNIDSVLLRRLARPLEQPGVISLDIANRIVAWVDYFSARLSLLQDLSKKRGDQGTLRGTDIPFVHARWVTREIIHERTTLMREKTTEVTRPHVVSTVIERVTTAPFPGTNTTTRADGEPRREMPTVEPIAEQTISGVPKAAPTLVDALPSAPSRSTAIPDIAVAVEQPSVIAENVSMTVAKPAAMVENASIPVAKPLVMVENAVQAVAKPLVMVENASKPVTRPLVVVKNVVQAVAKPSVMVENVVLPVAKSSTPATKPPLVVTATFPKVMGISTNAPNATAAANDTPVVRPSAPNVVDSVISAELPHLHSGPMAAAHVPMQGEPGRAANMVRTVPAAVIEPQPALQAPPPPSQAPEVDVDVLVDRVEKKLLRRIAAERDRRGGFE